MPDTNDKSGRKLRQIERKYHRKAVWDRMQQALLRAIPFLLLLAIMSGIGLLLYSRSRAGLVPSDPDALNVYVLDVGQGDAILLQCQGHAALIDAGDYTQGTRVVSALHSLGISRLDYAVNSHPHADHIGGMQTVLRRIPADVLILPDFPAELTPTAPSYVHALEAAAQQGVPVRRAECGERLPLGGAEIRLLCTDNSGFTDLNNCSLVCRVTFNEVSFFFAGDLEAAGEAAMLADGLIEPVTVLKVSHHGSNSSGTAAFLAAAQPQIAVISVGAPNDYGHPGSACLSRLREAGCDVFRTDLDGTVLLSTNGSRIAVSRHITFSKNNASAQGLWPERQAVGSSVNNRNL